MTGCSSATIPVGAATTAVATFRGPETIAATVSSRGPGIASTNRSDANDALQIVPRLDAVSGMSGRPCGPTGATTPAGPEGATVAARIRAAVDGGRQVKARAATMVDAQTLLKFLFISFPRMWTLNNMQLLNAPEARTPLTIRGCLTI
jgi:hypothetical protein